MVIAGNAEIVGSRRGDAMALIEAAKGVPPAAHVTLAVAGGVATIDVTGAAPPAGTASVYLARVLSRRDVDIGGGENRGRVITYSNVVREMTLLGKMGAGDMRFEAPAREETGEIYDRLAVIVQDGDTGAVLAVAMARLEP